MATSDFLAVAIENGADADTNAAWAAFLAANLSGFPGGQVMLSTHFNKAVRQSSLMSAAIAQAMVNVLGQNVQDPDAGASVATLAAQVIAALQTAGGGGNCYVGRNSNTQLAIAPKNGNSLKINGLTLGIPSGGITVANTGVYVGGVAAQNLAANTAYLLFVFNNGGVITPDFWTLATGHRVDTTAGNVGVEVRNNSGSPDSTRSLIAMVLTDSGAHFPAQNTYIINWFNRHNISVAFNTSVGVMFSNTSPAEITGSLEIEFLTWGEESVFILANGNFTNDTAGQYQVMYCSVDGSITLSDTGQSIGQANGQSVVTTIISSISEGAHIASVFGNTSGGSSTATATVVDNRVTIRG